MLRPIRLNQFGDVATVAPGTSLGADRGHPLGAVNAATAQLVLGQFA
jgi:hypothetical protein